jgi:hypothetical protein
LVVDPEGVVQAVGHGRQHLAVPRRPAKPPLDVLENLREAWRLRAMRGVQHRCEADVHVRGRALDAQEGGIQRREALGHLSLLPVSVTPGSGPSARLCGGYHTGPRSNPKKPLFAKNLSLVD